MTEPGDDACKDVDSNHYHHYQCRTRHIDPCAHHKPQQTAYSRYSDRAKHHGAEPAAEHLRNNLGHCQHRHQEHDSDKPDCQHNADGDKNRHGERDKPHGHVHDQSEITVEGTRHNLTVEQGDKGDQHKGEYSESPKIGGGDGQHIAEQKRVEFRDIAGGHEHEKHAHGHSQRPYNGNRGILAHPMARGHPFHAE